MTLIIALILSYPQTTNGKIDGSPGAKTNSPADGNNCTGCHNGNINTGPGGISITSNIPSTGYIPGETYMITTTINENGSNLFGFEITAEGGSGISPKIGTWIITEPNMTKKVNADGAITHTSSGVSGSNNKSWSAEWTAPSWGMSTGIVTFYAAGVAANGNGNNAGDNVYTTEYLVNEQQPNSINNYSHEAFDIFYVKNIIKISSKNELKEISVYDINGRNIFFTSNNSRDQYIDTKRFQEGHYIIKLIDIHQNIYTKKISIY